MLFGRVNVNWQSKCGSGCVLLSGGKNWFDNPLSAISHKFMAISAHCAQLASVCWHIKGVRPDGVLVQSRHQPRDETTTGICLLFCSEPVSRPIIGVKVIPCGLKSEGRILNSFCSVIALETTIL